MNRPLAITVINPTITHEWNDEMRTFLDDPGIELIPVALAYGTGSIESRVDDELATPGVIEQAILAEESGSDAIVVNCMDDPGLHAAREAVGIPVTGPAEASMHLAAMLAHRFTIVTTGAEDIPVVEELIARNHLTHRAAPVRALGMPVLQLDADPEATFAAFLDASRRAIEEDGSGAIIPGCSLLSSMADRVSDELAGGGARVPVLNPLLVAIRQAENLVRLGVSHSRRSYPPPAAKPIRWHDPAMRLGPRLEAGSV